MKATGAACVATGLVAASVVIASGAAVGLIAESFVMAKDAVADILKKENNTECEMV